MHPRDFGTHAFCACIALVLVTSCKHGDEQLAITRETNQTSRIQISPEFFPIAGPAEDIPRNRTITRNYFFGAEALQSVLTNQLSDEPFQANWLHFGIWGSMRAGEAIDGTDTLLAATYKDLAVDTVAQSLSWLPSGIRSGYLDSLRRDDQLIKDVGKIIRDALAKGNQRVANEIMGLTDRYLRMLGCSKTFDQDRLDQFLGTFEYRHDRNAPFSEIWNRLLEEIPALTQGKAHGYGQDALARAYRAYHEARFEKDTKQRAEMMHFGNLMIAIHEQFVLQTYISGSIGVLNQASPLYRKAATYFALDIGLPNSGFKGVSRMGEGLTRYPLRDGFPSSRFSANLRRYHWPPLVELANVTGINQFAGRGAHDWLDYKTRVYLIAGMIRTFQENNQIRTFPFYGPHEKVTISCVP